MSPIEFLKSIYLGDRYCESLDIDHEKKEVKIKVNRISRIRDKSGIWEYYYDEDIEEGVIVIYGVNNVVLDESGLLPNDQIYDIYAIEINNGIYEFTIETSYVDEEAITTDLIFKFIGKGVYLVDPSNPNIKIEN